MHRVALLACDAVAAKACSREPRRRNTGSALRKSPSSVKSSTVAALARIACDQRAGNDKPANAQARKAITTHMSALAAIKSPSTAKIRHIGAFKPGADAPGIPSSRSACGKLKAN